MGEGDHPELNTGKTNTEYVIKDIKTDDKELKGFLFTLGCYEGESVTIISDLGENCYCGKGCQI